MTEIDGVVERAYREGNNIVAVCRGVDGAYLQSCVIPVNSAKHEYLKREFDLSDPDKVKNLPATFTVSGTAITNAASRQLSWAELCNQGFSGEQNYQI